MSIKHQAVIIATLGTALLGPAARADVAGSLCVAIKGQLETLQAKGKAACIGTDGGYVANNKLKDVCVVYDGDISNPKNSHKVANPECGYWEKGTQDAKDNKTVTSNSAIEAYVEVAGFTFFTSFVDKWSCSVGKAQTCTFVKAAKDPKQNATPPGPADAMNYISAWVSTDGDFLSDYKVTFEYTPFPVGKDGKPDPTKPKQDKAAWEKAFAKFNVGGKFEVSITCGAKWTGDKYIAGDATPAFDSACKTVKP